MEVRYYICKHCGNIIAKVKDTGVPIVCCGEPMSEIIPGTTDAAVEKHVPRLDGGKRRRPCEGRLRGASYAAGALYRVDLPPHQTG